MYGPCYQVDLTPGSRAASVWCSQSPPWPLLPTLAPIPSSLITLITGYSASNGLLGFRVVGGRVQGWWYEQNREFVKIYLGNVGTSVLRR